MNYTGLISMLLKPASQVDAILNSKLHKHRYFLILKNCSRWKQEFEGTQKPMFYERSTLMWKVSAINAEGIG